MEELIEGQREESLINENSLEGEINIFQTTTAPTQAYIPICTSNAKVSHSHISPLHEDSDIQFVVYIQLYYIYIELCN